MYWLFSLAWNESQKKTFCDTGPKKSFQFESDKDVIEDDADDDMSDIDDDMSANDNLSDAN